MVHPDHQRHGIARALLDHVAMLAAEAGKRALSLNTVKQTGNVSIFSRLGFVVVRETIDDDTVTENLTDEDLIDVYMEKVLGEPSVGPGEKNDKRKQEGPTEPH